MAITYLQYWKKFNHYKLSNHKEKGLYIRAVDNTATEYNPFEMSETILFELLTIGWNLSKHIDCEMQILTFVNQFGLLGIGQATIEQEYEDCSIKLYNGNPFDLLAIHYTDLMNEIFPFEKTSHRIIKGHESRPTIIWEIKYEHLAPNGCAVLCHEYCERPGHILWYANYLYTTLVKLYKNQKFEHRLWNTQSYITQNKQQKWKFDSLKSAVDIMFMDLIQSNAPDIKLCKRCEKPYLPSRKNSQYCSPSCRNVNNVKNSRARRQER